ncbi:MAG: MoxR family ATPase, partial [Deltaproteobacteria bacterium]|nr:MoxR family ATPase [Deltaproteobacteria bacterium]
SGGLRPALTISPKSPYWEFVSNIVKHRNGLDPATERALLRGTVGEAAAVEFSAFLNIWRELPHPRAVLNDPANADIPANASALMALCGSLYRLATDVTMDAIVTFAERLRREVGESLVGACVRRDPGLQRSPAFIRWAAARTQ